MTTGISEKNLDAIILDIPNPWDVVEHAYKALKPGGYLCTYSPLSSQVENTVKEIKNLRVGEASIRAERDKAIELLEEITDDTQLAEKVKKEKAFEIKVLVNNYLSISNVF